MFIYELKYKDMFICKLKYKNLIKLDYLELRCFMYQNATEF